jgi:hypothetical protein
LAHEFPPEWKGEIAIMFLSAFAGLTALVAPNNADPDNEFQVSRGAFKSAAS